MKKDVMKRMCDRWFVDNISTSVKNRKAASFYGELEGWLFQA